MQNPKQQQDREKRNEEIVKLYPELTLQEIGKRYNLTHERVRQIIKKVSLKNKNL